jgi:hypothetical protein
MGGEGTARGRHVKLWALILIGLGYCWFPSLQTFPAAPEYTQGVLGVLLGLFICSHPAAAAVDLLVFGRHSAGRFRSQESFGLWLALNVVTLLVGWLVIFAGTTRLVVRPN